MDEDILPMAERQQHGVQAVEVAVRIAGVLSDARRPLAVSDIARETGLAAAKVHRYLASLVHTGFVEQDHRGRYGLSNKMIELGLAAQNRLDEFHIVDRYLKNIHSQTRMPVAAAIWTVRGPVLVRKDESEHRLFLATRIGSTMSLIHSATGQVFAAFLPRQVIEPGLAAEFAAAQIAGIQDEALSRAEFAVEIAKVQESGVAIVRGELIPDMSGLASPVFNSGGNLVMVLTIFALSYQIEPDGIERMAKVLVEAARDLSAYLGYDEVWPAVPTARTELL